MKKHNRKKYWFTAILLLVLTLLSALLTGGMVSMTETNDKEELLVVTSFYPMYTATINVTAGCDGIRVENLSEPQTGCLHDYQLTPQDMQLLSRADVFVINGGGIESFLADVAKAYPKLVIINASDGLLMEEDNAHVWMSISRYRDQVQAICDGLCEEDEADRDRLAENCAAYQKKIDEVAKEADKIREKLAGEPVLLFHEAFAYFAEECDLTAAGVLDLDEERQVSAGEVAQMLELIQEKKIRLILAEEQYGRDMGEVMERESDVTVLYLDPLVRAPETGEDADSWLTGMRENLRILSEAVEAGGI